MSISDRPSHQSPRTPRSGALAGFSVVEVLVALMLVTIGILGIAGSSALTLRVLGRAQRERAAGRMAADRFAMLASSGCGVAASGSSSAGSAAMRERWQVDRALGVTAVVDSVSWQSGAGERVFVLGSALPC